MRLWVIPLAGSLIFAQTQVDLRTQGKDVDFSGGSNVKPMPVGTMLPATCTTGAMFFKSNAPTGSNLYGCAGTSWTIENGTGLQSLATSTVFTITGGNVDFTVNGLPMTLTLGPATITAIGGTDTGTFFVFADYNSGAPALRCYGSPGINFSNYTVSNGFTGAGCTAGTGFPAYSIPLATVDVSSGVIQNPQDHRPLVASDPIIAGAGLSFAGNVISAVSAPGNAGVQRISYALLPACSSLETNAQFLFTDGIGITAHCNGASYAYFYNDQPVSLPGPASGFTAVNAAGGSTISDDQGGLYVHAANGMGDNLVTALKPLSGATDIRAAVVIGSPGGSANACGVVLSDGTTTDSKVTLFGRQSQSNAWLAEYQHYDNYTTGTTSTQRAAAANGSLLWFRVVLSGTTHTYYVSPDGRNWEQFGSETAYETAAYYGVGCDARGTDTSTGMVVASLTAN
jgi:hypothetical protein